jgi:predicted secreted protein
VWPQNDQNGKIRNWRGRAELILESRDFGAASKLAGELSTAMPISNMAFSLSTEARETEEKRLLDEAAKAFSARATQAAKAFGFGGYTVKQLDLSGGGVVVAPQPRGVAAMATSFKAGADVPLESGKSTVTVSVRGTVYLTGQ